VKNLIINADDFGLAEDVNQAIIQGHQSGCITSTSLMPTGAAVEGAVQLAKDVPTLGVGVHLTLVAEKPVLSPDKVPSLVDENGYFFADHMVFIKKYLCGNIDMAELRLECEAQIERVESFGIVPTHLDSHQHLHVLPKIMSLCLDLAKRHHIEKMRIPAEGYTFSGGYPATKGRMLAKCGLTFLAERARLKAKQAKIAVPDHFFGMVAGGHMQECYLQNILAALPTGTSEIMMHPGLHSELLAKQYTWQYHWTDEYNAVTSANVLQYIKENHVNLISFKELVHE